MSPQNRKGNRKLPAAAEPFKFKAGQSGNPGGRPKQKPVTDMYREIMSDPANLRKFCKAQFDAACDGDTMAAKDIIDRLEGKPLQSLDVSDNRKSNGAERLAELFTGAIAANSSDSSTGRTN